MTTALATLWLSWLAGTLWCWRHRRDPQPMTGFVFNEARLAACGCLGLVLLALTLLVTLP